MSVLKLGLAALLGAIVACAASPPTQEGGGEPSANPDNGTETSSTASDLQGAPGADVTQPPNLGCGYTCHSPTGDIIEVSWRFCQIACPGGPSNCSVGPTPPCP